MRFLRVIFIVIIIVLFAIIYTQNLDVFTHTFELKLDFKSYLIGPYITKNIVLILVAFVVGAFVALVFGALQSMSASSDAKRKIRELQAQVTELSQAGPGAVEQGSAEVEEKKDDSPFAPPS
jgi:uncharacterized membrane protein (DUF106 family)